MIVRARRCAPADSLRNLSRDTAHAGRIMERLLADSVLAISEAQACTTFPVLVGAEQQADQAGVGEIPCRPAHAIAAAGSSFRVLMESLQQRTRLELQCGVTRASSSLRLPASTAGAQRSLTAAAHSHTNHPTHCGRSRAASLQRKSSRLIRYARSLAL